MRPAVDPSRSPCAATFLTDPNVDSADAPPSRLALFDVNDRIHNDCIQRDRTPATESQSTDSRMTGIFGAFNDDAVHSC